MQSYKKFSNITCFKCFCRDKGSLHKMGMTKILFSHPLCLYLRALLLPCDYMRDTAIFNGSSSNSESMTLSPAGVATALTSTARVCCAI